MDGRIEKLDGMHHRNLVAETGKRRLQLKQATGIAGGNNVGVERSNELRFALAEGVCGVGFAFGR